MKESKDLKPGDRVDYILGGQTLVIEPIPYGRLKKLMKIVFSVIDKLGNMDSKMFLLKLPEIFEAHLGELVALIFNPKTHAFINQAWVDENVSLVDMREIVEKAIVINGLKDFLDKLGGKTTPQGNQPTETPGIS